VALYHENFDNGTWIPLLLGADSSGFRWVQSFVVMCPCVHKVEIPFMFISFLIRKVTTTTWSNWMFCPHTCTKYVPYFVLEQFTVLCHQWHFTLTKKLWHIEVRLVGCKAWREQWLYL
jgi:hypothetical protein